MKCVHKSENELFFCYDLGDEFSTKTIPDGDQEQDGTDRCLSVKVLTQQQQSFHSLSLCLVFVYILILENKHGCSKYKRDSGETSESDQNTQSGVDTPSLKIVTSDTDVSLDPTGFWISLVYSYMFVTEVEFFWFVYLQLKTDYWFESDAEVCLTDLWNNNFS